MKKSFYILIALVGIVSYAYTMSSDYHTKDGYVAEGYDVVEYFNNNAVEGKNEFTYSYDNAKYKFISQENLSTFKANPEMYVPQYGGWCAYAMALNGDKVSINPETFEIRDGKLYLFYNALFTNTLESWLDEEPDNLVKKADENWKQVKDRKK